MNFQKEEEKEGSWPSENVLLREAIPIFIPLISSSNNTCKLLVNDYSLPDLMVGPGT